MKEQSVNAFLLAKTKYFNASAVPAVKQVVERLPESALVNIEAAEMKDPTTMLIISLFLGGLGVDRFMIGDTGMGILKLLTGGLCGIMTIIDWFTIQSKTRSLNYEKFMMACSMLSPEADTVVHEIDPTPETDPDAEELLAKKQEIKDKIDDTFNINETDKVDDDSEKM